MNGLPDSLRGAIDLHVPCAPDVVPRRFDAIDVARAAAAAGFSAVVLTSHLTPTMATAMLAAKMAPEVAVHGALVLNDCSGGFHPAAVETALALGARAIWMPTYSAHNHKVREGGHGGLTVFDAHGELRQHVKEVLILVARAKVLLATGHLSPEEGAAVIRYAYQQGARRLLVSHPERATTRYPVALQRDLARYGVFFERRADGVEEIAAVGVESTVLSSGLGEYGEPAPLDALLGAGMSEAQLRQMMVDNPRHLLQ